MNATIQRISIAKNGNEYIVIVNDKDRSGVLWIESLTECFRKRFQKEIAGQIFAGGTVRCKVTDLAPKAEYAFFDLTDIEHTVEEE